MRYLKKEYKAALVDGVFITEKWGSGWIIYIPNGIKNPIKPEYRGIFTTTGIGIGYDYNAQCQPMLMNPVGLNIR